MHKSKGKSKLNFPEPFIIISILILMENRMDALEEMVHAVDEKVDILIQLVEQQIAQTGKFISDISMKSFF